jgi:radical SAM protein with 4Fe4S-binding SPASM domain
MMHNKDIEDSLDFSDHDISSCLKSKGLLSIELEFTRKCNLRCLYCYSGAGMPRKDELRKEEIKSIIHQAKDLGARKIILLGGGEPLLYNGFNDIVQYIRSLGLQQVLFTNGTLITEETVRFLLRHRVSVIIKQNSLNPEIQDMLAGVQGSFEKIQHGIRVLMDAGYPAGNSALGIQTVICRQNIHELPSMWTWAREKGIIPYFEVLTMQGRARNNAALSVTPPEAGTLFEQLEHIDKVKFGIKWRLHPTIAAFSCRRHLYSCLINSQGCVQPCTGVDVSIGNVRDTSLKELLMTSDVMRKLRNIYNHLEGRCGECAHSFECYGCRGNAYQLTGNYLASDPACWRYEKAVFGKERECSGL